MKRVATNARKRSNMTKREMFMAVIEGNVTEEVIKGFKAEIDKMDARNAKRAETPSKRQKENAPLIEAIHGILTNEPQTAAEIAEKVGVSTQKASALLRGIEGLAVTEVKVKGKGKVKGYALA